MNPLMLTRRRFVGLGALAMFDALAPAWAWGRTPEEGELGAAVLGGGERGRFWAQHLHAMDGVRLRAVADPDGRSLEALCGAAGGPRPTLAATSQDLAVLADPAVRVVWVTGPPARSAQMARAACLAGKDVYLDAPLAPDRRALEALVRTAVQESRLLQHGLSACSNPSAVRAVESFRAGRMGAPVRASIRCTAGAADPGMVPTTLVEEVRIAVAALGVTHPAELRAAHGVGMDPATGARCRTLVLWCRFAEGPVLEIEILRRTEHGAGDADILSSELELQGARSRVTLAGCGDAAASRWDPLDRGAHGASFLDAVRTGRADGLRAPLLEGALAYLMLWNAERAARASALAALPLPPVASRGGPLPLNRVPPMILSFPTTVFAQNAQVTAQLTATGPVLIESDLSASSMQANPGTVNLGPARPGVALVRYSQGGSMQGVSLLLLPTQEGKIELVAATPRNAAASAADQALLVRFGQAVTQARLTSALGKAFPGWIASNAAALGGNAVVCLLVVPLPAKLGPCGYATVGTALSLITDILKQIVDDSFQGDEAKRLKLLITTGNTIAEVLLPSGKLDKVLSTVSGAVEATSQSAGWKLTVKYAADTTKKYHFLLHLKK